MLDYILQESSFTLKYDFGFTLHALPLPTTSPIGFQSLLNELSMFKIAPSNITVDSPSNNLGDLVLSIKLLNRVLLRLTYGYFEVLMLNFQFADFESGIIDNILTALCNSFKSMSIKFNLGVAKVVWGGHLSFDTSVVDTFFNRHAITDVGSSLAFAPHGVLYNLELPSSLAAVSPTFGISESLLFKNEYFAEFSVSYNVQGEPLGLVKRFCQDLDSVFKSVISISSKSFDK